MEIEKFLRTTFILAIIINIIFYTTLLISIPIRFLPDPPHVDLIIGIKKGPVEIDPLNAQESIEHDIIRHVAEGLFMYNYSDHNLTRIPALAVNDGTWDETKTRLTLQLRDDVFFHDGAKFNAEAVKWNVERWNYFINAYHNLTKPIAKNHLNFKFIDQVTPLINSTEINDDYNITLVLNAPYAPIHDVLCSIPFVILSPHSTSKFNYINFDELVGTGPFYHFRHPSGVELTFGAYDYYYRRRGFLDGFLIRIINDDQVRNNAILSGDIDIIYSPMSSMIPIFQADPDTDAKMIGSLINYQYLGIDCDTINSTFREAISLAFNSSYIFFMNENITDANYLPPNYFDATSISKIFNITRSREIMTQMGYGNLSWTDYQWREQEFARYNISYTSTNIFQESVYLSLSHDLELIGIKVDSLSDMSAPTNFYWDQFVPSQLNLYNFYSHLFSNNSLDNLGNVNDPWLEQKFMEVLVEVNSTQRNQIYLEIQEYLANVLHPHLLGYYNDAYVAYNRDLTGIPEVNCGLFYAYPLYWDIPSLYDQT